MHTVLLTVTHTAVSIDLPTVTQCNCCVYRCEQLREVVLQLEARNTTLEKNFSELTQRLLQAQVTEGELRDELASCLPSSEKSLLDDHIAQLSKSVAELNIENSKLKEVAEVARQQGITVEMMQKSHDLEVSSLRTQLLDLQGVSDERTADGRLYHQILTLQISESTALKRLEEAEARVRRSGVGVVLGLEIRNGCSFRIRGQEWVWSWG